MKLLIALLAVTAAGQDYIKWPISSSSLTYCSMNAASIICAYEVQLKHDVAVRELYAHIGSYTAGTMTMRLAVQEDSGGVPSGVDLAYVDVVPNANGWVGGAFGADVRMVAGQTYWQVARFASYSSGSFSTVAPQPMIEYASRVAHRRYDGSAWSTGAVGAGMLMVDAHGWPIDPVPVIQLGSTTGNYTKTCRADRPMEIAGIVEWRSASGQAASYVVTAQSGSGSGYVGAGASNDAHTYAYVWLDQPVRVGAGQYYTIQRTTPSAGVRYGVATGLPPRLANYFQPLCSGSTILTWPIERPLRVVR